MDDDKKKQEQNAKDTLASPGPQMGPRDEAPPGTPGTGEDIDPKTGETYTKAIGGG